MLAFLVLHSLNRAHGKCHSVLLGQVDFPVEQVTFCVTCTTDKGAEKSFANQVTKRETKISMHLP